MKLSEYINSYPRNDRKAVIKRLSKAVGVGESTIRSWQSGQRVPRHYRLAEISRATNGVVDTSSLLNEFYGHIV